MRPMNTALRSHDFRSRRPVRSLLAGLSAALLALAAQAQGDAGAAAPSDADEAFYQRAATCAAAMEDDQHALVERVRAGATELRPELVQLTQLGFTYVGSAYKRGLRNPRADQMLKDAHLQQKGWDAARHAKTVKECRVESQALYEDASSVEQWFVAKRANSRVDRFLSAPARPASAASR